MADHKASRTLVKSGPELWAECSDATSLTRHLRAFGQIRISRLEPETAVAWEGDAASGTVRLEPAGWGTRVILSATAVAARAVEPEEVIGAGPEEVIEVGPEEGQNPAKAGALARLLARLGLGRPPEPETSTMTADPRPAAQPTATGEPQEAFDAAAALDAALDSLGRAHHRPYSRA